MLFYLVAGITLGLLVGNLAAGSHPAETLMVLRERLAQLGELVSKADSDIGRDQSEGLQRLRADIVHVREDALRHFYMAALYFQGQNLPSPDDFIECLVGLELVDGRLAALSMQLALSPIMVGGPTQLEYTRHGLHSSLGSTRNLFPSCAGTIPSVVKFGRLLASRQHFLERGQELALIIPRLVAARRRINDGDAESINGRVGEYCAAFRVLKRDLAELHETVDQSTELDASGLMLMELVAIDALHPGHLGYNFGDLRINFYLPGTTTSIKGLIKAHTQDRQEAKELIALLGGRCTSAELLQLQFSISQLWRRCQISPDAMQFYANTLAQLNGTPDELMRHQQHRSELASRCMMPEPPRIVRPEFSREEEVILILYEHIVSQVQLLWRNRKPIEEILKLTKVPKKFGFYRSQTATLKRLDQHGAALQRALADLGRLLSHWADLNVLEQICWFKNDPMVQSVCPTVNLARLEKFLGHCQRELDMVAREGEADSDNRLANLLKAVTLQYNQWMKEYTALRGRCDWRDLNVCSHLSRPHPVKSAASTRGIGVDESA